MPTTTFVDVKMTEDLEDYTYEKQEYNFSEGDIVSIPYHTGSRFVNKWEIAEYEKQPYEIDNEDYEDVVCRVKGDSGSEKKVCNTEKSDGEICKREEPCSYHGDDE